MSEWSKKELQHVISLIEIAEKIENKEADSVYIDKRISLFPLETQITMIFDIFAPEDVDKKFKMQKTLSICYKESDYNS